jgi:predicted transcriptional regulator
MESELVKTATGNSMIAAVDILKQMLERNAVSDLASASSYLGSIVAALKPIEDVSAEAASSALQVVTMMIAAGAITDISDVPAQLDKLGQAFSGMAQPAGGKSKSSTVTSVMTQSGAQSSDRAGPAGAGHASKAPRRERNRQLPEHGTSAVATMELERITRQQPAVPIKECFNADFLVCLEDGKKMKMLKRHLRAEYDLTPEQYRTKWGLPSDFPMVAPNYAKQKSRYARSIGLGSSRMREEIARRRETVDA